MDIVNSLFEMCGAAFILLSIRRVLADRGVRGVSLIHVAFFTGWGFWNLAYYPFLGQWYSFWGGVGVVGMNSVWLFLLVWFSRRKRDERPKTG